MLSRYKSLNAKQKICFWIASPVFLPITIVCYALFLGFKYGVESWIHVAIKD